MRLTAKIHPAALLGLLCGLCCGLVHAGDAGSSQQSHKSQQPSKGEGIAAIADLTAEVKEAGRDIKDVSALAGIR